MSQAITHSKDEYSVVVVQRGQSRARWEWEIYRNGRQLPLRLREGNFGSETTAMELGKVALREFLDALVREQDI
jgi:hypothetical protein